MTTRRVRDAAISLGEVHCEARAGIEAAHDCQRSERDCQPGHVQHSIRDVSKSRMSFVGRSRVCCCAFRDALVPMSSGDRLAGSHECPWTDAGRHLRQLRTRREAMAPLRLPCRTHPRCSADRRWPRHETRKARDAPEFVPLSCCDADGSLEPTAYRCRLFFVRMSPLGEAAHDGSDPKSARSTPLGAIAMTVLGALWS
jgi:hypothetical protein